MVSNEQVPEVSTYRTMYNFLRNPQSGGILQDEGHQLLALLQIPAWVAVQHLQRSRPRSAAAGLVTQASLTSGGFGRS